MALGGVATGSIKAQEADIVAGIISNSGEMSRAVDVPARIGMNRVIVATLDVSSVIKLTIRHRMSTRRGVGSSLKNINC